MHHNPEVTIAECVRGLRVQAGLTQVALARELGVSDSLLSHIEAGRRAPSLELLQALAVRFGISAALLLVAALLNEATDSPAQLRASYEALNRAAELASTE